MLRTSYTIESTFIRYFIMVWNVVLCLGHPEGRTEVLLYFFYFSVLALMCPQSHRLTAAAHISLRETDGCPLAVLPFFLCAECLGQHWLVTWGPRQDKAPHSFSILFYMYKFFFDTHTYI